MNHCWIWWAITTGFALAIYYFEDVKSRKNKYIFYWWEVSLDSFSEKTDTILDGFAQFLRKTKINMARDGKVEYKAKVILINMNIHIYQYQVILINMNTSQVKNFYLSIKLKW